MKDIFPTKKTFGQIAENNDCYDEISGKKNKKNFKKVLFDSRITSYVYLRDFFAQYLPPIQKRSRSSRMFTKNKFPNVFSEIKQTVEKPTNKGQKSKINLTITFAPFFRRLAQRFGGITGPERFPL